MHATHAAVRRDDAGAGNTGFSVLGDHEFNFLREFVYKNLGIALSEHKRQLVQGRLARRLRQLHLADYVAYCNLLREDPEAELGDLASVISTNVTAFFREPHHYELLEKELLPQWLDKKRRDGDRLRIWSAGCSSGEEPYAIAMVVAEALEKAGAKHLDVKILATDLSPQVLETARNGVYPVDKLGGISAERRHRWLQRGDGANAGFARMHPHLRELVTVKPLNLLHDWPMKGPFDAIFCRNVVIYFDTPTKKRLFSRYATLLPAGGYLFLGHSESMHGISDEFDLVGRTTYRKKA